jgi:hypothetical protein
LEVTVSWQNLYQSCLLETDPAKLEKLVFELEDAIVLRYHEIALEPKRSDEEPALKQAAEQLLKLKIERLGWADPAKAKAHFNR